MGNSREEEYLRRLKALGYEPSLAGMDDDDIEWELDRMDGKNPLQEARPAERPLYPRYKPVDPGLQARILRMFGQPYDKSAIDPKEAHYLNGGWDDDDDDDAAPQAKPAQNLFTPQQSGGRQADKPWTLNWDGNVNMFGAQPQAPGYRPEQPDATFPSRGAVERPLVYGPGGNGAVAGVQPMSANVTQPVLPPAQMPNITYPLQPKNIIFPKSDATPKYEPKDPLPEGTMITNNDAGANTDNIEQAKKYPDVTDKLNALMAEYEEKYKNIKDMPLYERLPIFYKLVTDKGILDIKRQPGWESPKFIYNGEVVNNDVPGNILYGYLGKHFDFPDTLLYFCAGGNQIANDVMRAIEEGRNPMEVLKQFNLDTFGDHPRDTVRIRQGIETWKRKYQSE